MAETGIDSQLLLFRRQYLQLVDAQFLAWPPKELLRQPDAQQWLFRRLFDPERVLRQPPERYQLRVLKPLLAKIEDAIVDPEEDEISDDLMSHLTSLITAPLPPETTTVQQESYVTYTCHHFDSREESERTITILEKRNLISGSGTTGFRTWEAALHLSTYLLTPVGKQLIAGKSVFELGAGTGLLSILCARHLSAKHVTITDGDEGVIETLKSNLFLNELQDDDSVVTGVLRWGRGLKDTWVEEDCEEHPYDVVLGADIIYDQTAVSALVATIRFLFDLRPRLNVIISAVVRNLETFETFRHACARHHFDVQELSYFSKPFSEQQAMFYSAAVPIKILSIKRPADSG